MKMTNKETITQLQSIKCHCQEMYEAEIKNGDISSSIWGKDVEALDYAIKALEEMDRFKFEISECKAILDNPTPDVTENDKKRAMYVLQTFPDMRELPEQTFGCAED